MIDTNKYEGHTPAPWRIVEPSPGEQHHFYRIESETEIDEILEHNTWVAHTCVIHEEDDDSSNTFLIADAPLLLEEVKRLRELIKEIAQHDAKEYWSYELLQKVEMIE